MIVDIGLFSLGALLVALVAFVVLITVGYRAVTARPTADDLRPDLDPKRILAGMIAAAILAIAFVVFVVTGIIWLVLRFTGGA